MIAKVVAEQREEVVLAVEKEKALRVVAAAEVAEALAKVVVMTAAVLELVSVEQLW